MEDKEVHDMFHRFNQKYFWGKLGKVRLNWSKNMTLCAGKIYCRERRGSTSCGIYLSQPLLVQRPPEDTVNTLLHEMIHAYLFLTEGASHKMGHGPAFREHMTRINKLHGSKITVFHNFRKEVDKFRVHVYRCDGPCTKKRPYFGVLRRAITRPPGPTDRWWAKHSQECGGTFHKVEGPDITLDSPQNTSTSVSAGSVGYPDTPSPIHTPSPKHTPPSSMGNATPFQKPHTPSPKSNLGLTFTPPRHTLSSNPLRAQKLTPSPKPSHPTKGTFSGTSLSDRMAARDSEGESRKALSGARKRLTYNPDEDIDSEDQLVQRIKQRHAHTSRSVLLSKEETRMIWRGPSPERGTLVEGRVNYNFRSRSNLNIRKYLERYRAVKEARVGRPQKAPVFQSPHTSSSATQKSSRHHLLESDSLGRMKDASSSQSSPRDKTQTDISLRTGTSSSQAPVPSCVTCWNCGVNVMVPGQGSNTENSCKPQDVSVPIKKKVESSVPPNLVACPSCGEKVAEEELNKHLDECLMPFTDDF